MGGHLQNKNIELLRKIPGSSMWFFIIFQFFCFANSRPLKSTQNYVFDTFLRAMFFLRFQCLFTGRMFQKKTSKKFVKIPWLKHVKFFKKRHFSKIRLSKIYKVAIKKSPYFTLKLGLKTRFCRNLFTLKIDLGWVAEKFSAHTKGVQNPHKNF